MREPVDWPTRDLLTHRVRATPERTALVDAATGESWTYRALDGLVDGTAAGLREHLEGPARAGAADDGAADETAAGREPADGAASGPLDDATTDRETLGVLVHTGVPFARLLHAAMRLGVRLAAFDPRHPADQLRPQAARAGVDCLVCEPVTAPTATAVFDGPVVAVDGPGSEPPADALPAGVEPLGTASSAGRSRARWHRDDDQLVLFTSGTTGEPRGIRLTPGNLVASATASAFRLGVRPDDRWLVCLPTCHMGGLAPLVRSTLAGTAAVVQRDFDAAATAAAVDDHRVTGVSLVPTMLGRLLDAGWDPPAHLRFVLLGGAPATPELVARCRERDVPVHPTYGMTEAASQIATATPGQAFAHPGTVGQPLLFTEVTVAGPDGDPVAPGETGDLVVDGPTVTPGYLDDAATAAAFGDHGLHTGDVGYRDEDGRLWVVGRADDVVVTGGENVHPATVVEALVAHDAVADAAVVGLPDAEWGERLAALVVPASEGVGAADGAGRPALDPGALSAHCRERLAGYAVPKTWGVADALPRTASGTVDREAVRARLRGE